MAVQANEVFFKTPAEEKIFLFTVPAGDLATGETIDSVTITGTPTGGSHVVWGTPSTSGLSVQSKATGGVVTPPSTYQDYHWTLTVNTTISGGGSQKLVYCGDLRVREC